MKIFFYLLLISAHFFCLFLRISFEMQQRAKINRLIKKKKTDEEYSSQEEDEGNELLGQPYMPLSAGKRRSMTPREENPVVFLEISTLGGTKLMDGTITQPRALGRLYFELRNDFVPVACSNFMGKCDYLLVLIGIQSFSFILR